MVTDVIIGQINIEIFFVYLGWDLFKLDALFTLTFELVLGLPGKIALAFLSGGGSVAGDLQLGLAVDALTGACQPLAVLLEIFYSSNLNYKFKSCSM